MSACRSVVDKLKINKMRRIAGSICVSRGINKKYKTQWNLRGGR
jgi:hypothetical protein